MHLGAAWKNDGRHSARTPHRGPDQSSGASLSRWRSGASATLNPPIDLQTQCGHKRFGRDSSHKCLICLVSAAELEPATP